jgi:hypothetical protein
VLVDRWRKWRGEGFEDAFDETYERVQRDGAIMAREIKADGHVSGGWWNWHPNKTALEYFWRTGKFAIAGRSNFQKVYDLVERVIPAEFHEPEVSREDFVDWACRSALARLGFATHGEIAAFWALLSPDEAKAWVTAHRDELTEVLIEPALGGKPRPSWAFADFPTVDTGYPEPPAAHPRAQPVRSDDPRPQPYRTPFRLLLPHRDLRARAEAGIRLLRLPAAGRRPADRPHRHESRPQARNARRQAPMAGTGRAPIGRSAGKAGGGA